MPIQPLPPDAKGEAVVRVLAAVDAEPGPREVTIRVRPDGAETIERKVSVDVRPPIARESLRYKP